MIVEVVSPALLLMLLKVGSAMSNVVKDHVDEAGKLADIAVLDRNPLDAIENSDSVSLTVINGAVYDANSMHQLWPQQVERGKFYFEN